MNAKKRMIRMVAGAMAAMALAACSEGTSPADQGRVAVSFGTASGAAAASYELGTQSTHVGESLTIGGSNGTLTITDLRLIVAEFELERAFAACDTTAVSDDACEKFQAPPVFVDLPLNGAEALAVNQDVPADSYSELEFEIEDLDDDEEDPQLRQQIEQLRTEIRAQFPDWPDKASVLVVGTFTPTNGEAVPFSAYFEAEVEVELAFQPPITIVEGSQPQAVTVRVDPALWFRRGDGTVVDVSQYDYQSTGQVARFELEVEGGFTELEWDH